MPTIRSCVAWSAIVVAPFTAGFAPAPPALPDLAAKKPSLVMRANPIMSFTPAKVRFSVDLRGGADDFEEFYCPSVEWIWDDDTRSESTPDCDPYVAGQSQIKRHYTMEHVYRIADSYRPEFRFKRKDKVIATVSVSIEVQPGLVQ